MKYVCPFAFPGCRFHLETVSLYVINCPQASKALPLTILTTVHTNDLSEKGIFILACLKQQLKKTKIVLMLYARSPASASLSYF